MPFIDIRLVGNVICGTVQSMIINTLISVDAELRALQQALAASNNPYILTPNIKTAGWISDNFNCKHVFTYAQFLGKDIGAATDHQMMFITVVTLQKKAPLLLEQAFSYNNIINTFYRENAEVWPPDLNAVLQGYAPHYHQIITAHVHYMLQAKLIPAAVLQLQQIKAFGNSSLELNTIIFIKPNTVSVISKALLAKLQQIALNQKEYIAVTHDANIVPMHTATNSLEEMIHVNELSSLHNKAIVVSVDARFKQLHQSYYNSGNNSIRLLHGLCTCITAPNKNNIQEIFHQELLSDEIVSFLQSGDLPQGYHLPEILHDLLALIVMLKKEEPFINIVKTHLALCKKMGGDVDAILQGVGDLAITTTVPDYKTAAMALFNLEDGSKCFSLVEACETPAAVFVVQGLNRENWPHIEVTVQQLNILMQRGEVIFTRAVAGGRTVYEEAPFLAGFTLNRIQSYPRTTSPKSCMRPNPNPPLVARPRTFSVAAIEFLIRDPYAYYARYILDLYCKEKEHVLAKDFGILVHEVMAQLQLIDLPSSFLEFEEVCRNIYEQAIINAKFLAAEKKVVLRRLNNLSPYIYELLSEWKKDSLRIMVEVKGHREISLSNGAIITLKSRADRIDDRKDGSKRIIDYKTGNSPNQSEVDKGLYPQLPLEAIIHSAEVASLFYVQTSGKIDKFAKNQISYNVSVVLESVIKLMEMFLIDQKQGYFAAVNSEPKTWDYQHLSRAEEWKY